MSRIRTIKPEAFRSETLSEISLEACWTFFGLLTEADDDGRLRRGAAERGDHGAQDVGVDPGQVPPGLLQVSVRLN